MQPVTATLLTDYSFVLTSDSEHVPYMLDVLMRSLVDCIPNDCPLATVKFGNDTSSQMFNL